MSFTVRPVCGDDWERLRDVRLLSLATDPDAFGSTYEEVRTITDTEWRARAEASARGLYGRWFAAVDGGEHWIGVAFAHAGEDEELEADLFGMWVAPRARGTGIAAALCEACSEWAVGRGLAAIVLAVLAGNERAVAAYRKAGFAESGRVSEQYGGRELDLILTRRDLPRVDPVDR